MAAEVKWGSADEGKHGVGGVTDGAADWEWAERGSLTRGSLSPEGTAAIVTNA